MRLRVATYLLVVAATPLSLIGCGGEKQSIAQRWNEICGDSVRERTSAATDLVTATDYRRFVDRGHRTLERLREVASDSELDAQQREALAAFAAQRMLERDFLAQIRNRALSEIALDFTKPADAVAARVRRTFTVVSASECAEFPSLR